MSELLKLMNKRKMLVERLYESQNTLARQQYLKLIGLVDKEIEQIKKDRGIEKE